jgi:hypothetical protein
VGSLRRGGGGPGGARVGVAGADEQVGGAAGWVVGGSVDQLGGDLVGGGNADQTDAAEQAAELGATAVDEGAGKQDHGGDLGRQVPPAPGASR